jgi:hypothetical protein
VTVIEIQQRLLNYRNLPKAAIAEWARKEVRAACADRATQIFSVKN